MKRGAQKQSFLARAVNAIDERGVELSMNVIIIAAIALIVLVVLVLLVTRAANQVGDGTGCQAKTAGQCVSLLEGESCGDALGAGYVSVASDCPAGTPTCCFRPLGGGEE